MVEPERPQTRVASVMEDPSAQAVARTYANALLASTPSAAKDETLEEFASFLSEVLDKNPEFSGLLMSGLLNRDEKLGIINRVLAGRGSELFVNFLRVLAKHDRLELLPLILKESRLKHELSQGKRRVQVMSPTPLSSEALGKIGQKLTESFKFQPVIENKIDPALLGGVVIQVGDTVYDSSLRTRMKQLRERMRHRSLHEIQSGRNRFSSPEGN
ncbi:MAG: ATP synthase F1 subunit delta [Planctomycetaceae bacterium]